jgi:hypothetical protein
MSELKTDAKLLHRLRVIQDRKESAVLAERGAKEAWHKDAVESSTLAEQQLRRAEIAEDALAAKDAQIAALREALKSDWEAQRRAALEMSGGVL